MIEKAVKAFQMLQALLPKVKKISRGLSIFRQGIVWFLNHGDTRVKTFMKRQLKQQKKLRRRQIGQKRRQAVSLALKQEKLLIRTGLLLRKRYF